MIEENQAFRNHIWSLFHKLIFNVIIVLLIILLPPSPPQKKRWILSQLYFLQQQQQPKKTHIQKKYFHFDFVIAYQAPTWL